MSRQRPSNSRSRGQSGGKKYQSRGAGRTGAIKREGSGEPRTRERDKGLGGKQIEGRQAVRELLLAGRRKVHEVWIASELEGDDGVEDIVALAQAERVPVQYVARKRLESNARSEAPQGVLAHAAELPSVEFPELLRREPQRGGRAVFYVAIDGVTDPGNLGAIVRSCDGAGVDAVLVPRHRAVHVTPTVAKASAGAVEHVAMTVVGGLPKALMQLKEKGVWIVGLDDAADRELFDLGDLATDAVCLVLGAEGAGLSRLVRERCDLVVAIPMLGGLNSLNVSAAAALATYEVARHRRTARS